MSPIIGCSTWQGEPRTEAFCCTARVGRTSPSNLQPKRNHLFHYVKTQVTTIVYREHLCSVKGGNTYRPWYKTKRDAPAESVENIARNGSTTTVTINVLTFDQHDGVVTLS